MITVGSEEDQRHPLLLHQLQHFRGFVVAGSVPHDDRILPPVSVLPVEGLDELGHEELEGVAIRVGLEQTGVELPEGVDGNDEGDPWRHLLDRKAGAQSFPLPAPPPIVSRVDPGLVDVDDPLLILEEPEELEGALLPLDQTPFRVSMDRNRHNLLVVKAK